MNKPDTVDIDTDIAIAGGGLVGASLALALTRLSLKVVLVEASPAGSAGQPSFDERTTALSNGSRRIFESLGVWPLIEREAAAIRHIHVSDQGRFGFTRIDAAEQGVDALGYVVVNRIMGAAMWRRLEEEGVRVIAPARVTGMYLRDGRQHIEFSTSEGSASGGGVIRAGLAVAADGAQSTLRQCAGVGSSRRDYQQVALIANVFAQRFHDHVAYERFTPAGPLALLPMPDGRMGLVWVVDPAQAEAMARLPEPAFLAQLQETFGFRLGRFVRVGVRHLYPLSLTRSDEHVAPRLAIVGNAAQSLHPIAGQGFNLGLRDAASLAEVLADGRAQYAEPRSAPHPESLLPDPESLLSGFDPGDRVMLERYREWRRADRANIIRFTDGLVRLSTQPFGPVKLLRNAGMLALDLMPAAKSMLSRLSLGAAGRVPKLARGAPLR
ncbi:2-octaprenyl-6-methoxyphenol hydroxylase [Steroidobacter denitrificans]|uniref:2-octaprenyl-6-methoxyphenol hydroxylase n=1 Tax=Steroidobacter denitrificans TaxID=465721 RepID=A0A127F8B4_STEDE|nr:2-octaprenyl-6-methoxyphenyl hydroxylase [Steroidobacter denitrificans]AMN46676.1 2-octaprenyl-6-methoxyphenol hydroxylase [Steroidobacter denitrificans]